MPQQPTQPSAPRAFGGYSGPSQPVAAGPSSNGPVNRPANLPPKLPPKPPARVTREIEIEEGELSEGQFEDLYEPAPPITVNTNIKKASKPVPAPVESQPTSAVDTPDANFYGNDEDEGEIPAKDGRGGVPGSTRERSGSYSPFLSPRELQSGNPTPQNGDKNMPGRASFCSSFFFFPVSFFFFFFLFLPFFLCLFFFFFFWFECNKLISLSTAICPRPNKSDR